MKFTTNDVANLLEDLATGEKLAEPIITVEFGPAGTLVAGSARELLKMAADLLRTHGIIPDDQPITPWKDADADVAAVDAEVDAEARARATKP